MSNPGGGETRLSSFADYLPWSICINDYLKLNGDAVGDSLAYQTPLQTRHNQPIKPNQTDPRLNPATGLPVKNTLKYSRCAPDEESSIFDELDIFDEPLTKEGELLFLSDMRKYDKDLDAFNAETDKNRLYDQALLAYVKSTIEPGAKATIEAHKDWHKYQLPASLDYVGKTRDYLKMVSDSLSTGNSTTTVTSLITIMSNEQGEEKLPIYLKEHNANFAFFKTNVEDKVHKGFVSLDLIETIVLIKNINKENPPNARALQAFLSSRNLSDTINAVEDLKTLLITHNQGDMMLLSKQPDPASEQGSALIVSPSGKKKFVAGAKNASRSDHCKYCLKASGDKCLYFYHLITECNRKKKDEAKATAAATAMVATAPPTAPPTTAQESQQDLRDTILMQVVLQQQQLSDSISALGNPSLP